jgi:hypothetical protein
LQRADEEAARLYEEFVESFKADDVPGGKAFVRGGTINPDAKLPTSESTSPSKLRELRDTYQLAHIELQDMNLNFKIPRSE